MSGDEPIVAGMASRYATALFELADEARQLDVVERDLSRLAALVKGSNDLARLVRSPVFSRNEQARAMEAVLARLGVAPLTRQFVGLLAQKRRLFALLDIVAAFQALAAHRRGEMTARVTSAQPLSPSQQNALSDTLRAAFKRQIKLETAVDASLLGGLIVKVGSRMIDSSLATKLQKLRFAMREA